MNIKKKYITRLFSVLLAVCLIFAAMPVTTFAAVASDLPENMADHAILRALEYTGYDVQKQKDNGTLYQSGSYGSRTPADVLSDIHYGISCSGKETVADNSTITGRAPNIALFEQSGLCCAAFVTYFVCNYLPNIEGVDTQYILDAINATGMNSQAVVTWQTALNKLANAGKIEKIGTSSSNVDRSKLSPGDLIIFGNDENSHTHIAVYSGTYNGTDFLIHVGNDRGPEIMPVKWMSDSSNGAKASYPNAYYHLPDDTFIEDGSIEVYKTDENGKGLDGAVFTAVDLKNPTRVFKIGPTVNGYAKSEVKIPFSTYKISESQFPTDYQSNGTSEWTVTLDKNTPNKTITIRAVNTLIPGTCKIVKTSEDGVISGIKFRITGGGIDKTVQTGADGTIAVSLKPATYTIVEQEYDRYNPQTAQTVTVLPGKTATLNFDNTLKRGSLKVTKTAEDGLVEGHRFRLYGISLSGATVDMYAVTDKNGIALFENVPISGREPYQISEVNTNTRYVIPDPQQTVIEWNKVTEIQFINILKKWRADIFKVDYELAGGEEENGGEQPMMLMSVNSDALVEKWGYPYGETQGDAVLSGYTYGVFDGERLVDTYTTDHNGYILTKYYPCGENWNIREISVAEGGGYLLSEKIYWLGVEAEHYTVEHNTEYLDVYEQVIKGNMSIIKHSDNGETQLETPEVGAEFEVYLKSAGSYNNAEETERDYLVCDENGYAESKDLPFGVYVVHQVSGKDGTELLPDFEVAITQDGHTYRYLANNALFESRIRITKTDAESGNVVPLAGHGFQIYRPDGTLVTQTITYPQIIEIDTFYTDSTGMLITPEAVEYGKGFWLVEVSTVEPYVLDSSPIYFDITPDNSTTENGITVIDVVRPNKPQKGIIKIRKTGEVFSSVIENGGIYQPVYSVKGLEGAEFDIIAAEDIYSGGILRYAEGDIVETITSDSTGNAQSSPLYLGKYKLSEKKASYGTVLNTTVKEVELTYAGQTVEITETAAKFYNERQKAVISLKKQLEINELFGIGNNGELAAVSFGLYAKETLTAADGTEIPAGSLLEIAACDSEGNITFNTDIPVGSVLFVKEYATDSHYKLSEKEYPVIFEYADQTAAVVEIAVNDGEAVTNELIYGRIEGLKKDEDGKPLANAVFGLFAADTEEFTEDNALMTAVSTEDGHFSFERIPVGNFLIRELDTGSPAFVLNDTVYPAAITADGQVIEIEVENCYVRGSVEAVKVDKENTDKKLSGAVFEIYEDTDDNGKFDPAVDSLLGTMTETETGIYRMENLRYGGFFLHESASPVFYNADEGYYYFKIEADGETVTVGNTEDGYFTNAPKVGSLKIVKTSSDGKVEGFSFRVTSADGYDEVFITDQNGEILIENLRIDTEYLVSEVSDEASAGYILPDDKTAAVFEGSVTTVEMHNERKPVPDYPDSPQTGDNSNIGLWLGIAVLSGSALVGITLYNRKQRRKEGYN